MDRYLSLDASPVLLAGRAAAAFTDAVGRAGGLGFTDVLTHWPRPDDWYAGDEAVLDEIAAVLPMLAANSLNCRSAEIL